MYSGEVEREIQRQIELAGEAERAGEWITYLMRDPRRPDRRGNTAGWPVYVGQSDEFAKRVRNHLRKSEKSARRGSGIKARLRELLHAGVVPNCEVLDRQPTRLKSLLSETNFARLCRSRGYDIANQMALQNRAGPPIVLGQIPIKWLWPFTLAQAADDGIEVVLVCRDCRNDVALSATVFEGLAQPPKQLRDIRDNPHLLGGGCTLCGAEGQRRVTLRIT